MEKMIHVLLTKSDEEMFSAKIKNSFPETVFIDDCIWETEIPPAKLSITACDSKFVYIWNKEIYSSLPFKHRKDGKHQGPQSGMVIQLIRSIFRDNTLLSGSLSVGITVERPEVEKMEDFVKKVWKILKKTAPIKVVAVDPETGEIINDKVPMLAVGKDAAEWCKADSERYLRFNNSKAYMKPL